MTRVLIANDIHLRDTPPSSATDTYADDLLQLLREMAKKAKELEVDMCVWAGDVFDFKQPIRTSHKLILEVIEITRLFDNLWAIAGNHDLTQDRLSTLFKQQPLGVLLEGGNISFLDGWHPTLPVYGVSWQQAWHQPETRMAAFEGWRDRWSQQDQMEPHAKKYAETHLAARDKSLAVTHAPLYPVGYENEFDHIPTVGEGGISEAMGNVGYLTYGHIHEDHGIFDAEGVTYANHGALSRGSLHEYNRDRKIALTLWDSEAGFSRVDLPHKPAEEVFRLTEIDEKKAEKLQLDTFLEDVGNSTLAQSTTESVSAHIKDHPALEGNIKKRALGILEQVSQ